jgi:hypothetical protein
VGGTRELGTAEPGARPRTAEGRAGGGAGGGVPLLPPGSGGMTPGKFLKFCMSIPAFWSTSERLL